MAMKRFAPLLACLIASMLSAAIAQAQSWDPKPSAFVGHFRFLPRYSILNESGGIAGRDTNFRVYGEFDLYDGSRLPVADGWVRFENVDAWASHPILAYVLLLDDVLAMSDLKGEQLPVMAPFDVYRFTGKTDDGSSVELFASHLGPWLRLRGGTTPPPGSADFFTYRLNALAREIPFADFNGDEAVSKADLASLTSNFGAGLAAPAAFNAGDATGDHVVDGGDFLAWQRQFGVATPPLAALDAAIEQGIAAAARASVLAVPEPSSAALSLAALALGGALRRRRG
jgi:hypothetical protein